MKLPRNLDEWLYWTTQVAAASSWALWLQLPGAVRALLMLQAIDMMTGILAAIMDQGVFALSSRRSFRGVAKKSMVLCVVAACQVAGSYAGFPLSAGAWVACFFIVHEVISILENAARSGVPIPGPVIDALLRFGRKAKE